MKKRAKILTMCILLIVALSGVLSACNKVEYEFKPSRFTGEYEKVGIGSYFSIRVPNENAFPSYVIPEISNLKEGGYYYYDAESHSTLIEEPFDKNVVDAIYADIAKVGNNVILERDRIMFKDTGECFKFKRCHYAGFEHDTYILDATDKHGEYERLSISAQYSSKGRIMGVIIGDYATAADGTEYQYYIVIEMTEKKK